MEGTHTELTDFDTWRSLVTITAPLLRILCENPSAPVAASASETREEEKSNAHDDAPGRDAEKQESKQHRDYVDTRLHEFRTFEQKARGWIKRRRRRN